MRSRDKTRKNQRKAELKYRYKLSWDDYQGLITKQEGRCAICDTEAPLVVDHCHETKRVRGLLCNACNVGIGFLKEDKDIMKKALEYIS